MGKTDRGRRKPEARRTPRNKPLTGIYVTEYTITEEPIYDSKILPPELEAEHEELFILVNRNPRAAIPRLEELKEKYSDLPILYNWLSTAYLLAGDTEKVEQVVLENYERNPDYLFARLNYAQLCLEQGRLKEIPRIFNHVFDLKMLYPERDVFHVSEVVGFMTILGMYFLAIGEEESARLYHDILKKIAPRDRNTRTLTRLIRRTRWMKRMGFKF